MLVLYSGERWRVWTAVLWRFVCRSVFSGVSLKILQSPFINIISLRSVFCLLKTICNEGFESKSQLMLIAWSSVSCSLRLVFESQVQPTLDSMIWHVRVLEWTLYADPIAQIILLFSRYVHFIMLSLMLSNYVMKKLSLNLIVWIPFFYLLIRCYFYSYIALFYL